MEDKRSAKEILEQKQMKRYFRSLKRVERTKGKKGNSKENLKSSDIKQIDRIMGRNFSLDNHADNANEVKTANKKKKAKKVKVEQKEAERNLDKSTNNSSNIDISPKPSKGTKDEEPDFAQHTFWRDPLPDVVNIDSITGSDDTSDDEKVDKKQSNKVHTPGKQHSDPRFSQSTFWKDPLPEIENPDLPLLSNSISCPYLPAIQINSFGGKVGRSSHTCPITREENHEDDEGIDEVPEVKSGSAKVFYVEEKEALKDTADQLEVENRSLKDFLSDLNCDLRNLESRISMLEAGTSSNLTVKSVLDEGLGKEEY